MGLHQKRSEKKDRFGGLHTILTKGDKLEKGLHKENRAWASRADKLCRSDLKIYGEEVVKKSSNGRQGSF